ncbi:DUF2723 domain-containing protein [Candidatus Daviesbacteria bacterium]|nr:DUF2723 domain-containing protein [Candidatus Daviesbacteria bacterium]
MKYLKLAPLLLPIFAFFLYLVTAAPFMLWLDAGRFVSAIVTLGVANPPEPLYVLLAHPFTYLPIGSTIFKIQIFSALTAVLALLVLYKLMLVFLGDLLKPFKDLKLLMLIGLFSMAMLAFSYQFWSQAQNIENFILVVLIEVVVLYLILAAQSKKSLFVNLTIISALMGLSTGTNPVIASIVPSLLWVMWNKRKLLTIPGFVVWIIVGIVAIVAIHLYIPIRAGASPFLNYWNATTLEGVWSVSTGAGLNVFVPELGRINGFTGSPEIFFKSTWHFIEMFFIKFTPLLVPFILAGGYFLWRKSKYYFIFWGLIILTNWIFSGLYFSGNQESWFLVSDVAFVVLGGLGGYYLVTEGIEALFVRVKYNGYKNYKRYNSYIFIVVLVPFLVWSPFLWRRDWVLTEDYINNLYRPMEGQKAIIFGSSDLYDSVSFLVHDVKDLATYKPNVIPITDNLLYILSWYREHLKKVTDLKIPDDKGLKYDSAAEYSQFINEFFEQNISNYKIYVTIPAMRNNFLQAYKGQNLGPSLRIDETKFKLIPQGMLLEVAPKESTSSSNLAFFDYKFSDKNFPKKKPFMLEQTYKTELTGVLNEYAYSLEGMGDSLLQQGNAQDAFPFYQKAYDFNPKNAEVVSRLGNYYGTIGDHKKAAEYFEKALKIEPNNIGLLFNSAIAYENTGRSDKAIKNYNRVIQLSKGQNDQITQLAQTRLSAIKTATPSAALNTSKVGSDSFEVDKPANIQQQLLTPPQPQQTGIYQDKDFNLQFLIPQDFKLSKEKGFLNLSNNLKGKEELTFSFYSRSMGATEKLDSMGEKLPFVLEGPVLITQPVTIPGFEAVGKTHGSGEHLTFLLLLKKGDIGIAVKIYPGDSSKTEEFNQILGSINTLK